MRLIALQTKAWFIKPCKTNLATKTSKKNHQTTAPLVKRYGPRLHAEHWHLPSALAPTSADAQCAHSPYGAPECQPHATPDKPAYEPCARASGSHTRLAPACCTSHTEAVLSLPTDLLFISDPDIQKSRSNVTCVDATSLLDQ